MSSFTAFQPPSTRLSSVAGFDANNLANFVNLGSDAYTQMIMPQSGAGIDYTSWGNMTPGTIPGNPGTGSTGFDFNAALGGLTQLGLGIYSAVSGKPVVSPQQQQQQMQIDLATKQAQAQAEIAKINAQTQAEIARINAQSNAMRFGIPYMPSASNNWVPYAAGVAAVALVAYLVMKKR